MSKFLVTYHGAGMPSDPEQAAQAKAAFGNWLQAAGKSVIDPGAPLRLVSKVSTGKPADDVAIGGYSIIEASTVEDAIKILKSHPFVSRGGTLQVNQVMSV